MKFDLQQRKYEMIKIIKASYLSFEVYLSLLIREISLLTMVGVGG